MVHYVFQDRTWKWWFPMGISFEFIGFQPLVVGAIACLIPLTSTIRDRDQSSLTFSVPKYGLGIIWASHFSCIYHISSWHHGIKTWLVHHTSLHHPWTETVNCRFNQPPWPNPFHKPIIFQPPFLRILCKSQHLNRLKLFVYHSQAETTGWAAAGEY